MTPEQGLLLEVRISVYRLADYGQLVPWIGLYNVHQVRLEGGGGEETASHLVFCFPNPPTLRCLSRYQYIRDGFRVLAHPWCLPQEFGSDEC